MGMSAVTVVLNSKEKTRINADVNSVKKYTEKNITHKNKKYIITLAKNSVQA